MTLDLAQVRKALTQITDSEIEDSTLDLTNCDREPIHIPSAIQPHGALLVVSTANWSIVQLSENVGDYFGRSCQQLLNQPLVSLLSEEQIQSVRENLAADAESIRPLRLKIGTAMFSVVAHEGEGYCILEFEATKSDRPDFFDFYRLVKCPVVRLQRTHTVRELQQQAVKEIKDLFEFDRVMVYWFDEDGAGEVVAEAKNEGMPAYLGLHYPASDIPKQAKYLYLLNKVRSVPDMTYEPVHLYPDDNPVTGAPLDMTLVDLRSVSPLHVEYLTNMGVNASMSISLVRNERLVGLIACHHNEPKRLSFEERALCEFLGDVISLSLTDKQENEDIDYEIRLKAIQSAFVQLLSDSESLRSGLTKNPESLMALTGADGVAYCEGETLTLLGETPGYKAVRALSEWVGNRLSEDVVYQTSALGEVYSPAKDFSERTSGLLALALSRRQQIYVLWFRSEVLQTVNWAGNPKKVERTNERGELMLAPRRSFALWQQQVRGRSLPWKPCEIEAARELRVAVIGLVLQKSDELVQLNTELMRSNVELDSFAYVASHDLKEPLRGIHNYSSFLIEDYGETLGKDGQEKLQTLMRLTQRMESLINSLLHYSRLGRAELLLEPVDMNELVRGAVEVVKISQPGEVEFEVADLPSVLGDRTRISELFTNLITNGIKYNKSESKKIEIGWMLASEAKETLPAESEIRLKKKQPVFYVRDNGIGIREKHLENVFKIFKRLHPAGHYGGGTGAGLTIVRKIVERHEGKVWIASTFGEGSTFYFTFGRTAPKKKSLQDNQ